MSNNTGATNTMTFIRTPLAVALVGSVLAGCASLPAPSYNGATANGVKVEHRAPDVLRPNGGVIGGGDYIPPYDNGTNNGTNNGHTGSGVSKFHKMNIVQNSPQLVSQWGNLWDEVRSGYQFSANSAYRPRVEAEKQFLLNEKRQFLANTVNRASYHLFYTVSEAKNKNLPTELTLLPVIESGYDPSAESDSGAVGLWQIMKNTATRDLNMVITTEYDPRRDVVESTRGAYNYLKWLHRQFGDWELALAAYNAGYGKVKQAINDNAQMGKPTDFWSLQLPEETMRYVPRLIAVADIMANPNAYGLNIPAIANVQYFKEIPVNNGTRLDSVASVTGVSKKKLSFINQGLKHGVVTNASPKRLLVPAYLNDNQLAMFINPNGGYVPGNNGNNGSGLPVYPAKKYYIVQKGDQLIQLARRFNLSLSKLASYNNISPYAKLRKNQKLWLVPGMVDSSGYNPSHNNNNGNHNAQGGSQSAYHGVKSKYKVKRGDTLLAIAKKLRTTTSVIASLNPFNSNYHVIRGEYIVVPASKAVVDIRLNNKDARYKVQRGDNLHSVASKFGVSVAQLAAANGLNTNSYLIRGTTIVIPSKSTSNVNTGSHAGNNNTSNNNGGYYPSSSVVSNKTFDYRVKSGDSLTNLAKRYDTTVPRLAKLNHLSVTSGLRINQVIKIPKTSMDYKVRAGDGLIMLAKRFNTTPKRLAEMNGLSPMASLRKGQTIQVPLR